MEEIKASNNNGVDEFPKGLKVLAVDDDPISLKILDALLRKCHYNVTTTSQAREALNMLRENRNRFDLIITDVHMPDMDGFKLLELVGLEMDLPVIMLSVRSDLHLVMKGINHGACDYLVKPVRIEELRNIWQHVFRRKVHSSKSLAFDRYHNRSESAQGPALTGNTYQIENINGKRKDLQQQEEEDSEHDDDDPSARKKSRFVWSLERHGKFVAAVNQLGIDKAVPKRILDLMNEEGLTRENVASHLQKYRLFLRKKGCTELQQGQDASYMGTLNELGDLRTLAGSGMLSSNTGLTSYAHSGGMLGRLNNRPVNANLGGFTSSAVIQPSQNLRTSINALGKFRSLVPPVHSLDQFQQKASTFMDPRVTADILNISTAGQTNPSMLSGISQKMQNGVGFINQSSTGIASIYPDSFNFGSSSSSDTFEDGRFHETWQNNFQPLKFPSNPLTLPEPHNNVQLPSTSLMHNSSSSIPNSLNHFSSNPAVSASLGGPGGECQGNFFGAIVPNGNQQVLQDCTYNSDNAFSNLTSVAPFGQCMGQNNGTYSQLMEGSVAADISNGEFEFDAYSSF